MVPEIKRLALNLVYEDDDGTGGSGLAQGTDFVKRHRLKVEPVTSPRTGKPGYRITRR